MYKRACAFARRWASSQARGARRPFVAAGVWLVMLPTSLSLSLSLSLYLSLPVSLSLSLSLCARAAPVAFAVYNKRLILGSHRDPCRLGIRRELLKWQIIFGCGHSNFQRKILAL